MKIKLLLSGVLLASVLSVAFVLAKPTPSVNVTGIWVDSNSTAFQNCYVIFSQQGSKITMLHYLEFNGAPLVEEGKGSITGNTVSYNVIVTKPIEGWATTGKHCLVLSADGNTLRGTYLDGKGNKGPLVFKKMNQNSQN